MHIGTVKRFCNFYAQERLVLGNKIPVKDNSAAIIMLGLEINNVRENTMNFLNMFVFIMGTFQFYLYGWKLLLYVQ